MVENKLNRYFNQHKSQLQVLWFLVFGLAALIVQLGSRIICDIAFQGMDETVNIWLFPAQTIGSFLAFFGLQHTGEGHLLCDKQEKNILGKQQSLLQHCCVYCAGYRPDHC